jgi:hypothetical protein
MLNVAMFLGVCIAVYAVFMYKQTKLLRDIYDMCLDKVIEKYRDEIFVSIVETTSYEVIKLFKEEFVNIAKLGVWSVLGEILDGYKKEIAKAGKENYKELKGDKGRSETYH